MCRRTLHETNLIRDAKKPPPLPPPASFPHNLQQYEQTLASTSSPAPPPPPAASYFNRNNPALVMAMTIMAAIFFLSGIIHLLIRYLTKKPPFSPLHHSTRFSSAATTSSSGQSSHQPFQGQLHQLFRLHDSGLDQASIDALPVFHYKDIVGSLEPFDCAVCLCEFSEQDKLRLLPTCSHAFHTYCIDTWLLSNSTCPLCRGTLLSSPIANPPRFGLDDADATSNNGESGSSSSSSGHHGIGNGPAAERVLSVRLGKLRGLKLNETEEEEVEGESSRISCGRRCYSLGRIHEYVENESNLLVALSVDGVEMEDSRKIRSGRNCKGESFSVSKIWLWSDKNKSRFPASAMDSPTATLPFRGTVT